MIVIECDSENIYRLLTIRFGLRFQEDMSITLWINGILIHTSQLTWAIGDANSMLTLWAQLFEGKMTF